MTAAGDGVAGVHGMLWRDAAIDALFTPDAEIGAILRFETALARAQMKHGLVAPEAAAAIARLCAGFSPDPAKLAAGIARDGMVVPELIRQMRAALPEMHRDALHLRSTSQDAIDTALVLRLRNAIATISTRITEILAGLDDLDGRCGGIPQMARTRMQRALPTRAGERIAAWRAPFERHLRRLEELSPRLLVVQSGGPIGIDPSPWLADLAALLDLGVPPRSWHTARDTLAEFASWLSLLSGAAGKIGTDIAFMAQNELSEAAIAGGGTSSAMHHKSNPVAAELVAAIARYVAGQAGCFHQALVHEQERSGAAWALEWMILPHMLSASAASLNHLIGLLKSVTLRAGR